MGPPPNAGRHRLVPGWQQQPPEDLPENALQFIIRLIQQQQGVNQQAMEADDQPVLRGIPQIQEALQAIP